MEAHALKKLAIGYVRVSTQQQSELGESLDGQAARIRDYAILKGFTLRGSYEDVASALPGRVSKRSGFLQAVSEAKKMDAVIIVTDVSRLSRSVQDVKDFVLNSGIEIHDVGLKRRIGKALLLEKAKAAEAEGKEIGKRTAVSMSGKSRAISTVEKLNLQSMTKASLRQRAISTEERIVDIASFISADPSRSNWSRRQIAEGLNTAGMRTARGNLWTVGSLTRPLQKAKTYLRLQDEPDDGILGFDDIRLSAAE